MRILYLAGKCETYIQLNCIKCTRAWKFIYLNRQVGLWHKHTLRKLINFVQLCFQSHWCLSLQRANESKTCVNCFLKDLRTHISEEKVKFKENKVAEMAQWWEHSPPTNVVRVRFPDPASYVGWVCWFSSLHWEVSPILKNHHSTWFLLIVNLSLQCPQ